ncbi:hypothetical protein F4V91_07425 [Neorhizobium galegae]|uniref:Uncharacterized protein n=1 Tax=Neorhizobium galegae TaxID=399 RepID=A0A6A1TQ20_NEOGA|nr:hypothetical protein [Neorhizobium galegae]KAB1086280.1 hypothetical protein F4V91_07425 [Neorhizobium galegae]
MNGRGTTNILLAIIAGVLLFGSAAVTGVIKWIAIIGGALLLIYAAIAFALYLLRETVKSLVDAKVQGRDALVMTIFGLAVMVFLPIVGGYALLLWLNGVPKAVNVVTDSWVGKTWLGILILGAVCIAISHLHTRRSDIIPALRYGFSLLIRSPLAPLFLSMYGWRKARTAGDGVVSSAASAFLGLFFGLVFWLILVGIFAPMFGK